MSKTKKPKPDQFMVGFSFTHAQKGKTPYDFKVNEFDGKRPGENAHPTGCGWVSLLKGVEGYSIPPLSIWNSGFWYDEWEKSGPKDDKQPTEPTHYTAHNIWIVSGEGTPNNYKWRGYEVPDEIASKIRAQHPTMWPKRLRDRITELAAPVWGNKPSPVNVPKPPQPQAIPHQVRIRCQLCGHFFSENLIGVHLANTCPVAQGTDAWGMMCDALCGCENLHEAMVPKPGYPKQPAKADSEQEPEPEQEQEQEPELEPEPEQEAEEPKPLPINWP